MGRLANPETEPDELAERHASWRYYAHYIARASGIEPGELDMSDQELRLAAEAVRDRPGYAEPARRILEAFDLAEAGGPYKPYSR